MTLTVDTARELVRVRRFRPGTVLPAAAVAIDSAAICLSLVLAAVARSRKEVFDGPGGVELAGRDGVDSDRGQFGSEGLDEPQHSGRTRHKPRVRLMSLIISTRCSSSVGLVSNSGTT
jgi:hypothetical protein